MKKKFPRKSDFIIPGTSEPVEDPQERLFGYLKISKKTVELWPDDSGPLPDPPREHPWPVAIADFDFPGIEGGILREREDDFKKSENPVIGIECFLLAVKNGVYPSAFIMDWLRTVFAKYHKRQGKQSLDDIMGLNAGPGRRPHFKRLLEEERDELLCLDIYKLKKLFGKTTEEASLMVSRKLEETKDWNKSKFGLAKPSATTIEDAYNRKWHKVMNRRPLPKELTTEKKKQAFLNTFPPDVR